MTENMVRLYDLKTKTVSLIPARELAPGMRRIYLLGTGEVWMDESFVRTKGPFLHPPFPPEVRAILSELQRTFKDAYPKTLQEWEDGFRRDANPAQEIAVWRFMAGVYRHYTQVSSSSRQRSSEVLYVIVNCVNNGTDNALPTTRLESLSKKKARKIISLTASKWRQSQRAYAADVQMLEALIFGCPRSMAPDHSQPECD